MNKIYKVILAICIALHLSACASGPPTQQELTAADYGISITQENAQNLATEFILRNLKDPDSAQFKWGSIHQGWMREAPIHGSGLVFGYILDVNVNAKNSFGGYVGYKPYKFVFYGGSIKTVYGQQELSDGSTYMGKIY